MTGVDIYQLCVPSAHAGALIDDWAMRRVPVTLRLRLARTPGHSGARRHRDHRRHVRRLSPEVGTVRMSSQHYSPITKNYTK